MRGDARRERAPRALASGSGVVREAEREQHVCDLLLMWLAGGPSPISLSTRFALAILALCSLSALYLAVVIGS